MTDEYRPVEATSAPQTRLDRVVEALDAGIPAVVECVERVRELLAAPRAKYSERLASHLAWLLLQLAGLSTELRQLEKHQRVMARTPEQRWALVLEYVRGETSPDQRRELARLLESQRIARVVA